MKKIILVTMLLICCTALFAETWSQLNRRMDLVNDQVKKMMEDNSYIDNPIILGKIVGALVWEKFNYDKFYMETADTIAKERGKMCNDSIDSFQAYINKNYNPEEFELFKMVLQDTANSLYNGSWIF